MSSLLCARRVPLEQRLRRIWAYPSSNLHRKLMAVHRALVALIPCAIIHDGCDTSRATKKKD